MKRVMWWLGLLSTTLFFATCSAQLEKQEVAREGQVLQAEGPTAADFPAPLIIDGIKGCAKIMSFEGIETCPSDGVTLLCVRKNADPPVVPPGASSCGTAMITGGQCREDGKLARFQCAAVVGMPTPTPTPDTNPLAACQAKRSGFCWTDGSFFGDDCFSNCECSVRTASTRCVGPSWGGTPKPTAKPTPRPTSAPTASPSPPPDPLAPCRDGRLGYCWTSGVFAGNDCFSQCTCSKREAGTVCVGPGAPTATPRPTASPRPTGTPSPAPTTKPTSTPPPISCPVGQHAELKWSCVADPSPVVTARPTASPRPTATPRPTASPVPTKVPNSHALAGVWFVPECTTVTQEAPTTRVRWYDWPYVWAAYPKGWNKHIKDYGSPCVPTQEVWTGGVSIPYYWQNDVAGNILKAEEASKPVIAALRERKQMIADMRAKGTPEDQLPKMPILWIAETSSSGYGYLVDLGDGFYVESNGKRTLRDPKTLPKVFPEHVEWLIETYKKEGVTQFADAPYLFFWAASSFASADNPTAAQAPIKPDWRGRTYQVDPPVKSAALRGTGSAWMRERLTKNNPTLWPAGYDWKVNPDNWPDSIYSNLDTPDAAAAKRDAGYYLLYLYAMKGQHPEVTNITPQITNCGYNKPNDSPWWDVSRMAQQFNQIMGYPAEAQIEGCQVAINMKAGRAPNAPYADCRAYQSIKVYAGGRVSMWLPKVTDAIELDKQLLRCPMVLQNTALTLPQTVSIVDDLLLKATPGM